jgi:hypothetical protein
LLSGIGMIATGAVAAVGIVDLTVGVRELGSTGFDAAVSTVAAVIVSDESLSP